MAVYTMINTGEILQLSNYWESEECANGRMFLSWNAGVGRLLVPEAVQDELFDGIRRAKTVEIEESEDMFELWFYDDEPNPYCVRIEHGMSDRKNLEKGKTRIDVYIELGIKFQIPAIIC